MIEYIPLVMEHQGYSPDNGQALYSTNACQRCAKWDGDIKVAPKLVKNEKGFRVCPMCGCPWG